jgi:hypothetical protein
MSFGCGQIAANWDIAGYQADAKECVLGPMEGESPGSFQLVIRAPFLQLAAISTLRPPRRGT